MMPEDQTFDRRTALAALAATALASGCRRGPVVASPPGLSLISETARKAGMVFGFAVRGDDVAKGSAARRLIARHANVIVPENAMKWGPTGRDAAHLDTAEADRIAAFAAESGIRLRGHTAFWFKNPPQWARAALLGPAGPDLALGRVRDIVSHFRGRVWQWDVLNEVIAPADGAPLGLRRAPFGGAPDPAFFAACFTAAREADPAAQLFYNEYGIENDSPAEDTKRAAVLGFLAELKRRGAPIDGLGIQSHLGVRRRFNSGKFAAFLEEVAGMGLTIMLTELDVNDKAAPSDPAARDLAVADTASRYLEVAFAEKAVRGVLCWGINPKRSWLQQEGWAHRSDSLPQRPLPLDDAMQPTALWSALAHAFEQADPR